MNAMRLIFSASSVALLGSIVNGCSSSADPTGAPAEPATSTEQALSNSVGEQADASVHRGYCEVRYNGSAYVMTGYCVTGAPLCLRSTSFKCPPGLPDNLLVSRDGCGGLGVQAQKWTRYFPSCSF
jgi:hypothetical protein